MVWNPHFRFIAGRNMTGSAGQKRVPTDFFSRFKIPLPPLPEQKRIAAILDKADAIRRKRQRAIEKSEDFLRSVFLDMFGDPVTNPKGWPSFSFREISLKFSDGPFGSNLKSSHYVDNGIRVIRLKNIGVGKFINDDKAFISSEHFQSLIKHQCLPGDVVIGTLGDPNLRSCIIPSFINETLNKADCIQLRPNLNKVTAEFISSLINYPGTLALASHLLHGQTRVRISMGTLRDLQLPIPPIELQQKYTEIFNRNNMVFFKQDEVLQKIESVFNALTHLAFRGELTNQAAAELLKQATTEQEEETSST